MGTRERVRARSCYALLGAPSDGPPCSHVVTVLDHTRPCAFFGRGSPGGTITPITGEVAAGSPRLQCGRIGGVRISITAAASVLTSATAATALRKTS